METSIEERISLLSPKKQKEFGERLMDVLHDRMWFRMRDMYYIDPNVKKVKEILFEEEYKHLILS